jgi:asparagine synthase (glutamine-hydrolysing)
MAAVMLTYNGEVYNFEELRLELEALGYAFRSRTDSEVLLTPITRGATRASTA